jgi:uncharacterized protein YndB with AHSA1/START domain
MQSRSFAVYIGATPRQVWNLITDPDRNPAFFFGLRATSDWREGSRLTLCYDGTRQAMGHIIEASRYRRLVYALTSDPDGHGPTAWLTWEITAREIEMSRVSLHHADLEPTEDRDLDEDILLLLSNLKTVLETGRSLTTRPI